MPSRRRTSRSVRPLRRRFSRRKHTFRTQSKLRTYHKPRLVRRYMRRKLEPTKAHPIPNQVDATVHVSSQDNARAKNPALKISGVSDSHDAIAAVRKTTVHPLNAEITAIPNPTPDTGVAVQNVTNAVGVGSPLLGAISSETGPAGTTAPTFPTSSTKTTAMTSSFSALPPLLSFSSTINTAEYTRAALPTSTILSSPSPTIGTDSKPHQVTAAVVILLSVGSALFLLGVCIVVKMCTRPKRHARPTPSLPVMSDIEADDEFFGSETKESPIFGGDARMSTTADSNGPIWTWVQYPQAKMDTPALQTYSQEYTTNNAGDSHYATHYPFATQTPTVTSQSQAGETLSSQHTFPNIPAAVTSSKRLSATAALYNPITHERAFTNDRQEATFAADGHDVMKRSKSKTATNRRSRHLEAEEMRYRDSTNSFVGLAYDAEVATPSPVEYIQPVETSVVDNSFEGRARVRSGYFAAGTYPRISTLPSATYSIATATRINVGQRNSFSKDKYSLQRSNSKRARDTQALTYALGLASPRTDYGAPSPQPTLYPDDSMSVSDARRPRKRNAGDKRPVEAVPDVPIIVPTQQAGGSTGTLPAMNFGVSQMSLSGLALDSMSEAPEREPVRSTDRPPRVPSPPPLLTLTQMGLAQHNPEAYANYRSPTYSLYGLYETPDRRSFVR